MTYKEWLLGDDVIEIVTWPPHRRVSTHQLTLRSVDSKAPVEKQPAKAKSS